MGLELEFGFGMLSAYLHQRMTRGERRGTKMRDEQTYLLTDDYDYGLSHRNKYTIQIKYEEEKKRGVVLALCIVQIQNKKA